MEDPCAISDHEFIVFPVFLGVCLAILTGTDTVSEKAERLGFCQRNLKEGGKVKGLNICVRRGL